ncbi:hypothetical protein D917_05296 [Trichinella nativa]|uniref:Uncharacterized protein n=1 Tax=Trichinella nativa TaxID=6335 RepID=A0A1Y3EWH7_9BILA|nr:hypothetical protein D917_05296 [Trichinella nativa]
MAVGMKFEIGSTSSPKTDRFQHVRRNGEFQVTTLCGIPLNDRVSKFGQSGRIEKCLLVSQGFCYFFSNGFFLQIFHRHTISSTRFGGINLFKPIQMVKKYCNFKMLEQYKKRSTNLRFRIKIPTTYFICEYLHNMSSNLVYVYLFIFTTISSYNRNEPITIQ